MIRICTWILILCLLDILYYTWVYAVDCEPTFNRTYTVEGTCDWPWNYKVYGDIIVWWNIVTVPAGRTMWVNLTSNKVTFSGWWYVRFEWTGKMDNSVSARYYKTVSYGNNTWVTNCPSWYDLLNTWPTNYQAVNTLRSGWSSGSFHCGK